MAFEVVPFLGQSDKVYSHAYCYPSIYMAEPGGVTGSGATGDKSVASRRFRWVDGEKLMSLCFCLETSVKSFPVKAGDARRALFKSYR